MKEEEGEEGGGGGEEEDEEEVQTIKNKHRNAGVCVPTYPSSPGRIYQRYMGDLTLESHTLESDINKDVFGRPRNS